MSSASLDQQLERAAQDLAARPRVGARPNRRTPRRRRRGPRCRAGGGVGHRRDHLAGGGVLHLDTGLGGDPLRRRSAVPWGPRSDPGNLLVRRRHGVFRLRSVVERRRSAATGQPVDGALEHVEPLVQQAGRDRPAAAGTAARCRRYPRSARRHPRRGRPCAIAPASAAFGSVVPGLTSSIAIIAPRPRMSPITSCRACMAPSRSRHERLDGPGARRPGRARAWSRWRRARRRRRPGCRRRCRRGRRRARRP